MKVKGVSFSFYKLKVNTYVLEKLDLFSFLFTKILLNEDLDKNLSLMQCLLDLDIKEDLFYLFNNVYYKFVDNNILIGEDKEDIYSLKLKDISLDKRFHKYLLGGYLPVFNSLEDKEFVYDYLEDKISLFKDTYDDSNVCVVSVDNTVNNLEEIINQNMKALFNDDGIAIVKDFYVDPYYFEIDLKKENDCLIYKQKNKDLVYKALKDNSLYLNDELLEGEYLSNNIYFKCLYGDTCMKDYCDYLFVYDKEKEGIVEDNVIYVNYNLDRDDFVDVINKENYKCGYYYLDNKDKLATYKKNKVKSISDFKLYLIKNKDKFKMNINEIIERI